MATGWSYSELSKLAKKFGGPEKMLEIIKKNSVKKGLEIGIQKGVKMGKGKMLPMVILGIAGGAAAGGVAVYYAISKKFVEEKKNEPISEAEAAAAEAILIDEIKKADEMADSQLENDQLPDSDSITIDELLSDD